MAASPAHPIPSTLDDAARDVTGAALQATLVDLVDLALVAKQAHWNLVGRQFHDVHLHLDELVDTARTFSDTVAAQVSQAQNPGPDSGAMTEKYLRNTAAATSDYVRGVRAPKRDPIYIDASSIAR